MKTILAVMLFISLMFAQKVTKQDSIITYAKQKIQTNLKTIEALQKENQLLNGLIIGLTTKPDVLIKQLKPRKVPNAITTDKVKPKSKKTGSKK